MRQLFCIDLAFHNEAIQMNPFLPKRQNSSGSVALATSFVLFCFLVLCFCLPSQWHDVGCVLHTFTCMWLQTIYYLVSEVSEISVGTVVLFTHLCVCRISTWYYVVVKSSECSRLCDIPL